MSTEAMLSLYVVLIRALLSIYQAFETPDIVRTAGYFNLFRDDGPEKLMNCLIWSVAVV